jgi:hypothetical protein
MDQESYIKMINWIRHVILETEELKKFFDKENKNLNNVVQNQDGDEENEVLVNFKRMFFNANTEDMIDFLPWFDDKWLIATFPNDMLLTFCKIFFVIIKNMIFNIDGYVYVIHFIGCERESLEEDSSDVAEYLKKLTIKDSDGPTEWKAFLQEAKFNPELLQNQQFVATFEKVIEKFSESLEEFKNNNDQMKQVMLRVTDGSNSSNISATPKMNSTLAKDDEYFESYDNLDIHAEMLKVEGILFDITL